MAPDKLSLLKDIESLPIFSTQNSLGTRFGKKSAADFLIEWRKRQKAGDERPGILNGSSQGIQTTHFEEQRFRREIFELITDFLSSEHPIFLKQLIDDIEKGIIIKVLSRVNGNQKKAAKVLGINYTTLNEKIKRYKIQFRKETIAYAPRLI